MTIIMRSPTGNSESLYNVSMVSPLGSMEGFIVYFHDLTNRSFTGAWTIHAAIG